MLVQLGRLHPPLAPYPALFLPQGSTHMKEPALLHHARPGASMGWLGARILALCAPGVVQAVQVGCHHVHCACRGSFPVLLDFYRATRACQGLTAVLLADSIVQCVLRKHLAMCLEVQVHWLA